MPVVDGQLIVEQARILGGPFELEAELAYGEEAAAEGAIVIAGPHPLLGGNMHNNVVRALGDGLAGRNLLTLRFNYRGVGRSAGPALDVAANLAQFWQTGHVAEEMDLGRDLQAAARFLAQSAGPELPLALVGYSFGCVLLPFVEIGPSLPQVLIAPTVGKHDYRTFHATDRPTLVIASDDDFAVDAGRLQEWFDTLPAARQLIVKRLDNHFFRGHEGWLVDTVHDFIRNHWR